MPKATGGRPGRKEAPGANMADGTDEGMQVLFGENFRKARAKAGLTQHDIEIQTGIKQAYISQIECGRQNPTLSTMIALARAVGKNVHAMLKHPARLSKRK